MNGHSTINTNEATEHLKSILNVGKPESIEEDDGKGTTKMESADPDSCFINNSISQKIELNGTEENIPIYGTDVSIYSSPLVRGRDSGKIFIDNIVDYGWKQEYYLGCLISVHISKNYLAYALKATQSPYGFVRIIKNSPSSHLLLRGFCGGATDIAFAHSMSRILLGCVDEIGELFVFELFDSEKGLKNQLRLHIKRPVDTRSSMYHRLVWCPYIPEDGSENSEDAVTMMMTSLLVVTHKEKAEIVNTDMVIKEYGEGEIEVERIKMGLQTIAEHKKPITAAAFSPDAIALATSSLDGEVKFFHVNVQENDVSPKCLHEWVPHHGKPLSSLFFLDNHKAYNSDGQFWKFALTGSDNNQEIKVWSCKTWQCFQKIRILKSDNDEVAPCLKAAVDMTANYLVLSDISRKIVYVMKIHQEDNAKITSICEYIVNYPILSFSIVEVYPYRSKVLLDTKNSDDDEEDDEDDDDDSDGTEDDYDENDSTDVKTSTFVLKLIWIHTKSCQQCRIYFRVKRESPTLSVASTNSSEDSFVYKDGLSDMQADEPEQIGDHLDLICQPISKTDPAISPAKAGNSEIQPPPVPSPRSHMSPGYQECKDVLLTPKDFTAIHSDINAFDLNEIDGTTKESSLDIVQQEERAALDAQQTAQPRRKSSQHSCASSPSREVAEILSPGQLLSSTDGNTSPSKKDIDLPCRTTDELQEHTPRRALRPSDYSDEKWPEKHTPRSVLSPSEFLDDDWPEEHNPIRALRPSDYSTEEWPQAPDPSKEYKVTARGESEIHVPSEQTTVLHNLQRLADADVPSDLKSTLQRLECAMKSLSFKLTTTMVVVQDQSQVLEVVKKEIQGLQQQQQAIVCNLEDVATLDNNMSSKIEHILTAACTSEFNRLETLCQKRDSDNVHRYEEQLIAMSQNLAANIGNRLDKAVKQEVKNTLIPHTTKYLETAVRQLQSQLLQKLNATDSAIKENISKHLKSKAFNDSLATTAVGLLQPSLQAACRDVFQSNILPSLNSFFQVLFAQLNDEFSKGSAEIASKSEKSVQQLMNTMGTTMRNYEEQITKLATNAENISKKINTIPKERSNSENERLVLMIKESVHDILTSTRDPAIVHSHPSTPVPQGQNQVKITQQDIAALIKQGDINSAFQKALSALDMGLVMFACETVSIEQVFEPEPCPLHQSVLLSLLNQLSRDIEDKTEIKMRFIEESISCLDTNNTIVKQHAKHVCIALNSRLKAFQDSNPQTKYRRNCRRIMLALETFLK